METIRGGSPDRFVNQYEAFRLIQNPLGGHNPNPKYGEMNVKNAWGITRSWPKGTPGAFPVHTPEKVVIKDICRWRDYVHAPSVKFSDAEWEPFIKQAEETDRSEYFVMPFVAPGLFEQCHHLGEIQTTLINLYEEPEAMHELIDYLTEFELQLAEEICTHLKPDGLFHHDDWGSQTSTFMSPAMFEEFYLPGYKKIYGYYKSHGVELIVHHSDSYAATFVPYMIDMGVDIWQGVLNTNNIAAISEKVGDRMLLMGGIDSVIDREDATEEEIRKETRRACEEYGNLKGYWPGITYGGPGTIYPHVEEIVIDEINRYNEERFGVSVS